MERAVLLAEFQVASIQFIATAVCLLGFGVAVGVWIGRWLITRVDRCQLETEEMADKLARLMQWSRGMAKEVSQFGSVVTGVSRLFSATDEPLNSADRSVAVGLLSEVVDANERLKNRLSHAEVMLQEQANEIAAYMSEARTDPLTGLPNRRAFDEGLARSVAEWQRHGTSLSILMLDIDHFKRVNDTYGHQTGDEVLLGVAGQLRQTMRESDLVARIGGEELAVVLASSDIGMARQAAERARAQIEDVRFRSGETEIGITVSVGASQCLHGESGLQMLNRADEALYAAKREGRNCSFWHDGQRCLPISDPVRQVPPEQSEQMSKSTTDTERDFAQVCEDLRRRLNDVMAENSDR